MKLEEEMKALRYLAIICAVIFVAAVICLLVFPPDQIDNFLK